MLFDSEGLTSCRLTTFSNAFPQVKQKWKARDAIVVVRTVSAESQCGHGADSFDTGTLQGRQWRGSGNPTVLQGSA